MRRARQKQLLFPVLEGLGQKSFGGSLIKGNAREARPISVKRPMHLVMRSSRAKGEHSLLLRSLRIERAIRRVGAAKGVKIYRYANSGNHLHLVILPRSRAAYHAFIRAIAGIVTRIVLGAERGTPWLTRNSKLGEARKTLSRFWDTLPFTKIIEWGRQYMNTRWYVLQNQLEAEGWRDYTPRKGKPPPRS